MERTEGSTSSASHQVWGGIEHTQSTNSSGGTPRPSGGRRSYDGVAFCADSSSSSSLQSEPVADEVERGVGGVGRGVGMVERGAGEAEREDKADGAVQALHDAGQCQPCYFQSTPAGCSAGASCAYCHVPHKRHRPRPSKDTRNQCKQVVRLLDTIADPQEKAVLAEQLGADSPYMRSLLHSRERQAGAQARPPAVADERAPAAQKGAGPRRKNLVAL